MSIHDRDYMKRRSDDRPSSSGDSKLESALSGFLQRHPRFFLCTGIALGVLVIVVIALVKSTAKGQ